MTLQDVFDDQILAFHAAIMDNCNRAAHPDQSDVMALRLRNNALALGRLQMVMLTKDRHTAPDVVPAKEPEPVVEQPSMPMVTSTPDRVLTGDALSRFASRRLEPGESPHEIWQTLQESEAGRRRNPALPGAGFRSPSG
jgi:hypothetical protein